MSKPFPPQNQVKGLNQKSIAVIHNDVGSLGFLLHWLD
jgi:hypothetical protein